MENTKKERFGIVLPIVLISYFMILLDVSIVFTSTVKISQGLGMDAQAIAWISNGYILTFGGLQLLGGRLGDLYGRKKIYLTGLSLFAAASLLVALSTSSTMLIAMRVLQGVGAAILAPSTLALLIDNYQGKMLSRGIAYYGATAGLGATFGLPIGGLIASFASWRLGFLINVPVAIAVGLITLKFVRDRSVRGGTSLDIPGTLFSVLGISGIIYGINGRAYRLESLVLGFVFLALFVWQERRARVPVMPLKLFKSPVRVGAYISRFFIIGMSFSYLFLTPQIMQRLYHYSPFTTAILFFLMNVPQFIFATLVPRLEAKWSDAALAAAASLLSIVSLLWIMVVGVGNGFWAAFAVPMVLMGIGQGLAMSPLTSLGVKDAPADVAGAASGVVNTFHQTGQSTGLAIAVSLTAGISSYTAAYTSSVGIMAVYAVISLAASGYVAHILSNKKTPQVSAT